MPQPGTTAAIVVHHRNWGRVAAVPRALLDQGVDHVVLVDNSEQPEHLAALHAALPDAVEVVATTNDGYAAAVNVGLRALAHVEPTFMLVATHEVVPAPGAIAALRDALAQDPGAAAAGPTLHSPTPDGGVVVWSRGGTFSRLPHLPAHVDHRTDAVGTDPATASRPAVPRQWLDGAFVLYRRADLLTTPMSERFFLYMEETDHHLRLGRAGRRVLWVPDAVVTQESGGTPPYWFARNLVLLFRRNLPWWRTATVPVLVGRAVLVAAIRRDPARVRALVRGFAAGLRTSAN